MVGLAFDSHTRDLRNDWDGKQTISTYWVDVLEYQQLKDKSRNQFWLASKYGGFDPVAGEVNGIDNLDDIEGPYDSKFSTMNNGLPRNWWYTNSDTLQPTARYTNAANGQPYDRTDNYFPAGRANTMVQSLRRAFERITNDMTSTASSLASNTARLETDTLIYSGIFFSGNWNGDLIASDTVTPEEEQDSDNQSSETGSGDILGAQVWSAADKLDALSEGDIDSRIIVTSSLADDGTHYGVNTRLGSTGVSFKWNNLTPDQQTALRQTGNIDNDTVTNAEGRARVEYLRGKRTSENGSENYLGPYGFRHRGSRLGDIVNSAPVYSHTENYGYTALSQNYFSADIADAYRDYRRSASYLARTPIVAVGANDGMFHIFDASSGDNGGDELFAYVPAGVVDNLYQLTQSDYLHHYYVDGPARVGDAYLDSGDHRGWHTLAVGTEGAGGSSVFALDITDPGNMGTNSLLWEYTNNQMGRLIERPSLVALPNGKFGVVVSSGYDAPSTASGKGYVWVLDASTGDPMAQIEITTDGELGAPLVVDTNNDEVADRMYVGDTTGHLWRIDLDSTNTANWGLHAYSGSDAGLMFQAKDNAGVGQPITAPLAVASSSRGYPIVLFGTGSYYRENDNEVGNNPQVQSLYGIIDQSNSPVNSREELLEQSILYEGIAGNYEVRVTSDEDLGGQRGWYMDLQVTDPTGTMTNPGERVVSGAAFSGGEVFFTTLIPSSDPCQAGGDSWIMGLEIDSGGRPQSGSFDLNDNGDTSDDTVTITLPDKSEVPAYTSGFKSQKGVAPSVTVIRVGNGASGSNRICYHGSEDASENCVPFRGGDSAGRQSWRELLNDSGVDFTGNGTNGN